MKCSFCMKSPDSPVCSTLWTVPLGHSIQKSKDPANASANSLKMTGKTSYHVVRRNWVKVCFQVTCPFHEGWVSLPSSWLYSLIPPSHWLWSLSLLPVSSSSSLSLQKLLSDLSLPAYSVVCAGLVKWIGKKGWLKVHQSQPKIRVGGRASGIGRRGKMGRTTVSTPRCWQSC